MSKKKLYFDVTMEEKDLENFHSFRKKRGLSAAAAARMIILEALLEDQEELEEVS